MPEELQCSLGPVKNTLKRFGLQKADKGSKKTITEEAYDLCRRYNRNVVRENGQLQNKETGEVVELFAPTTEKMVKLLQ